MINSILIALLAPAQDFRYQYPAYVVGLLLGPFLLWAAPGVNDGAPPGPDVSHARRMCEHVTADDLRR